MDQLSRSVTFQALADLASEDLFEWLRWHGEKGPNGASVDADAVLFAVEEIKRRGGTLARGTVEDLLVRNAWRDEGLAVALACRGEESLLIHCLFGECILYDAIDDEKTLVFGEASEAGWEVLRDEMERHGDWRGWFEFMHFSRLPMRNEARVDRIFDTLGGAIGAAVYDGNERGMGRVRARVEGVGGDVGMATQLLREHSELSLDALVECMASLGVAERVGLG